MSEVFAGIEAALSFGSLIANVTGVSLGILFGAMPGLTAAMGVALLIPLSFGMPPVEAFSMLLAMILGPLAESNFRRALSLSRDDFSTFFTSPISCAILAVSACVVLKTIWDEYRGCKREAV